MPLSGNMRTPQHETVRMLQNEALRTHQNEAQLQNEAQIPSSLNSSSSSSSMYDPTYSSIDEMKKGMSTIVHIGLC